MPCSRDHPTAILSSRGGHLSGPSVWSQCRLGVVAMPPSAASVPRTRVPSHAAAPWHTVERKLIGRTGETSSDDGEDLSWTLSPHPSGGGAALRLARPRAARRPVVPVRLAQHRLAGL